MFHVLVILPDAGAISTSAEFLSSFYPPIHVQFLSLSHSIFVYTFFSSDRDDLAKLIENLEKGDHPKLEKSDLSGINAIFELLHQKTNSLHLQNQRR